MRAFWILCTCQNHNKKCSCIKLFIFVSCIILDLLHICYTLHSNNLLPLGKCHFLYKSPVKSHQAITLNPFRACSLNSATQMKTAKTQTSTPTEGLGSSTQGLLLFMNENIRFLLRILKVPRGTWGSVWLHFLCVLTSWFFAFLLFALTNSSTDGVQKADTFL